MTDLLTSLRGYVQCKYYSVFSSQNIICVTDIQ